MARAGAREELDEIGVGMSGVVAKAKPLPLPVEGDFVVTALVAAACDLFEHLQHPVTYLGAFTRADAGELGKSRWVVIELTGSVVQGAVALHIPDQVAMSTHPTSATNGLTGAPEVDDDAVHDWSCEMTNLLVGGLKNELLRVGATVYLSVPRLIDDAWATLAAEELHRFRFERGGCFDVVLETEVDPSAERAAPLEDAIQRGSVLFLVDEE